LTLGPRPEGRLIRAVFFQVFVFLIFQWLVISMVTWVFGIRLLRFLIFMLITTVYHFLLYLMLLLVRKEFYLESSGKPLKKINLPIVLSFTRISSVPTVIFLLISIDSVPILPVVVPFLVLIFLTDFFDGILARRLGQTTRIGRIMDASGDYLNIMVISFVFFNYALIPVWFFAIVSARLLLHCAGMIVLYIIVGYTAIQVSFLGKASVFAVMGLYALELFEYLSVPVLGNRGFITVLEILTALILLLSLGEKLLILGRSFASLQKRHSS
jgi:phosphatidylglycerophosphate synthase